MAILTSLRFGPATVDFDFDGQSRIRSVNYANPGVVDVHVRTRRTLDGEVVHEATIPAGQVPASFNVAGNQRYSVDELAFDWSWSA